MYERKGRRSIPLFGAIEEKRSGGFSAIEKDEATAEGRDVVPLKGGCCW
jgi:hypothetical protein